ncbi:hypothetical protein [Mycobacterium sp. URHB0021]
MTADGKSLVPMWTLATEEVDIPDDTGEAAMTPERLADLRMVLATPANTPIATLEAHPIITKRRRSGDISLHAASPLAQDLSTLMSQTAKSSPAMANVAASSEVLYRMVVPAKVGPGR